MSTTAPYSYVCQRCWSVPCRCYPVYPMQPAITQIVQPDPGVLAALLRIEALLHELVNPPDKSNEEVEATDRFQS